MRIRTRDNLIEFLEENAFGRYLRALQNYNENLGAFSRIFNSHAPGWIVKVTSKYGDIYYLAAIKESFCSVFAVLYKQISWKYWIGDKSENPLYQGDYPEKYKLLRDKEIGHGNK